MGNFKERNDKEWLWSYLKNSDNTKTVRNGSGKEWWIMATKLFENLDTLITQVEISES